MEIAPGAEWAREAASAPARRGTRPEAPVPAGAGSGITRPPRPALDTGTASGLGEAAGLDASARRALATGAVLAVIFSFVPFLDFVFHYLVTLVHEFGHFATNWIFGYPSVPAFDFRHGGGVTMHQDRNAFVMLGIYALLGWLIHACRKNRPLLVLACGVTAAHAVAAFTSIHEMLRLFMGHGAELLFAGFFLWRALTGENLKVAAERPLYAFCAFFIILTDLRFSSGLMSSHEKRVEYELAKGGGAWMDFSQLADSYWRTELATVAGFFLVCTVAVPVLVWLAFVKRAKIREAAERLLAS